MPLTVSEAYAEALAKMARIDAAGLGQRMAVPVAEGRLRVPFFGAPHEVGPQGCLAPTGQEAAAAVGLVLCQYVLRFPHRPPPPGRCVSFRELEGAGPLAVSFANNSHKTICSTFGRTPQILQRAARQLGGVAVDETNTFDLFLRFDALPRIPVFLQFNACDEDFPATASLLFQQSARAYLNLQSLFVLGTYLTGRLISGPIS